MTLPAVIGHRGAAAYAPENTMAAFNQALSLNCRFLEFDVMCSKDGEPFVIHDDSLKRTTNGRGMVGEVESDYLRSLDAGSWFASRFKGEKIPSFQEVLQWLSFADVQANIEIKPFAGAMEQTTVAVLSFINRYWPTAKDMPLVSSFDWQALELARSIAPEMPLGLLMHDWQEGWQQKAEQLACYSVHCHYKILTAERAAQIKQAGFKLLAYTVNRRRLARKLLAWGVDAVFSDYPDLLV